SAGVLAINSWWIGPLLVLGRYAPPFTEFIESAAVTTNWLNPVEILRGTTSWTPFVDTERQAGYLLVNSRIFVILTVLVAALGLAGLALMRRRGLWVLMLAAGLLLLGSAQLAPVQSFLDGTGAPFRNIHKFDLLVRMPLMVGVAALGAHLTVPRNLNPGKRDAAGILVILIALGSIAPAWSGRLLPQGTWDEIPAYWHEATDFLNQNAAGTRTLILPSSPFARQDWGWTRDEPAQPLLDVPWAVRDAIPLVPPEAIRGLDGLDSLEDSLSDEALKRLGIGAVLVRHDLEADVPAPYFDARSDAEKHTFGEVDVYLMDPDRDMWLSDTDVPTVAGGGEILSLLDTVNGHSPHELVAKDADIVTDTPQLVGTNYGDGNSSAALADLSETEVRNRLVDYPSTGPMTTVVTEGEISVSSSASDATSFGGSNPDRSPNSLVDGRRNTDWYPTPGDMEPWIKISGAGDTMTIIPADDVTVTITSGGSVSVRDLEKNKSTTFILSQPEALIELEHYAGISEITMDGLSRTITVPDTSPDVQQFLFQRLTVPTSHLDRAFTAPRDMTVTITAQSCRDIELNGERLRCGTLELPRGQHMLRTSSKWVTLTETVPQISATPTGGAIAAADHDRLLLTSRAFNPGARALIGTQPLTPISIDAAAQAFVIPAGLSGEVEFNFAGEKPYRFSLFAGVGLGILVISSCLILIRRSSRDELPWEDPGTAPAAVLLMIPVFGWWLIPAIAAWTIPRFTLIPHWVMASIPLGIAGLWLAQAPWPSAAYPGDSAALVFLAGVSVAAVFMPGNHRK
ncbi:alpha-(1-_3)-arabinofuranosyltransferase family protein, partial [uncultured Corynebacterium sp.]|uniref:alpha-(1->3)-arabinofuranosyltransferase domain-containing protein n=1 Tax=uncultured Corynebacterium sp. TaxID=159447 RepID=UPI0026003C98